MAASQIRALKQQIVTVSGEVSGRALTQMPGGDALVEPYTPTARVPATPFVGTEIRGQITSVRGNLASVSVGSADGVSPGMIFLIYRPGATGTSPLYLGSLRITKVEVGESAGMIEQTTGDIREGDLARDELSFALRD
jgi:hypothetical protein